MENLIANHKRGTTWDGVSFTIIEDQVPLNLTGVQITADFKYDKSRATIFSFKTSNGTVLIPNPLTGVFLFKYDIPVDFPEAVYVFTVKMVFPDGRVEAEIFGNWKIY